jgi:tubulin-folding cofactor B
MADSDYDKVEDTYRKFRARQIKNNPNFKDYEGQPDRDLQKAESEAIAVGSRCEVIVGGMRGEVMYSGKVKGLEVGYWIGIKLDEPLGTCDGTVKGKKIFECGNSFGAFYRPLGIKVGDYPEIDEFDMDDDMI